MVLSEQCNHKKYKHVWKSALGWELVFDDRYPVMSWKHKPSIIQYVAFCIYFLWTRAYFYFFPPLLEKELLACLVLCLWRKRGGISIQRGVGCPLLDVVVIWAALVSGVSECQ